jgi:hypothetical protein
MTGYDFPLTGIRLWRWKLALKIYRLGCLIGNRHKWDLEYEEDWKEYYCPQCGYTKEEE